MKSKYFTSKSFKYLGDRIQNQKKDPPPSQIRSDFDEKIDLLRVPVYDRKKKAIRSRPNKMVSPEVTYTSESERKERNPEKQ